MLAASANEPPWQRRRSISCVVKRTGAPSVCGLPRSFSSSPFWTRTANSHGCRSALWMQLSISFLVARNTQDRRSEEVRVGNGEVVTVRAGGWQVQEKKQSQKKR